MKLSIDTAEWGKDITSKVLHEQKDKFNVG